MLQIATALNLWTQRKVVERACVCVRDNDESSLEKQRHPRALMTRTYK